MAKLVQRTSTKFAETMYLNLHEQHFSYVKNFDKYAKSYQCGTCGKLWKDAGMLHRHETTCIAETQYRYPGGVFHLSPTIFQQLRDEGVQVCDSIYPYRVTYDFESYFDHSDMPNDTAKVTWESQHTPLSVSVCSNVPGFDLPKCFVTEGDTGELIYRMMTYMTDISTSAYELMLEKYEQVLNELNVKIDEATVNDPSTRGEHPLKKLSDKFDAYLKEVIVLGFNSGKYDINVCKTHLMQYMQRHEPTEFIVKKNNSFMCLKSAHFKWLDITNYLAPGFSYDKYLKAYGCEQQKGFFPYEWVTLDRLNNTCLPPHEAFYSSLKKSNISAEEYAYCQRVWTDNQMQTVKDFLIWYNNLDVSPFLEAVEKQSQFYSAR